MWKYDSHCSISPVSCGAMPTLEGNVPRSPPRRRAREEGKANRGLRCRRNYLLVINAMSLFSLVQRSQIRIMKEYCYIRIPSSTTGRRGVKPRPNTMNRGYPRPQRPSPTSSSDAKSAAGEHHQDHPPRFQKLDFSQFDGKSIPLPFLLHGQWAMVLDLILA